MEKFDFDTIVDFDQHIEQSIPGYSLMWDLISRISSYFITKNTNVYDLGCSTGAGLNRIYRSNSVQDVKFIGYDISDNMIQCAENTRSFFILKEDITDENLVFPKASVILMVFTLQFIPETKKANILKRAYDSLLPGGCLLICEKTLIRSGKVQDVFTFSHYDMKKESFSSDEILSKQYDLRSIMKNSTSASICTMLNNAGFEVMKTFFQSLQFKGWLCIK